MSDGKWSGGAANRQWARPGSRVTVLGDRERAHDLFDLMAGENFWCETCGQSHPLIEHRRCRAAEAARPNPGR